MTCAWPKRRAGKSIKALTTLKRTALFPLDQENLSDSAKLAHVNSSPFQLDEILVLR
jgi:hypothetical protein